MISELKEGKSVNYFQTTLELKYILDKDLPLEEFGKWYISTDEILSKYSLSMFDYFTKISFFRNDEDLCNKFFNYCYKLKNLNQNDINFKFAESLNYLFKSSKLGPIVFATPELGRWSTVGGLGVMVDELSQALVQLGQEVIMITPYYEKNRKGETGYLSRDSTTFTYLGNIDVNLDQKYTIGIHYGVEKGVKIYFLHNFDIFPSPYAEGTKMYIMKQISVFSKAVLECLCFVQTIPAVVVTNDWFTGLVAAYSKTGHFGSTFSGTTFFHIVHNLEPTYEGRIYADATLEHIHKLPNNCLIDPFWKAKVINPSRCAILMSDQWGTVSKSYRKELQEGSPLNSLLNSHKKPFAYPNGIFRVQRLKALTEKAGTDRLEAKRKVQIKYFGYKDLDNSCPLYSFVGRITQQKGVILILEIAETIINRAGGKINILVGGMGNMKDPYCINCVNKINYLKYKYPNNFWADPNEFFTDGPTVNLASDFGLMPSVFEPGGIVQHEFFIAGTPVIAYKTGGLKDTVIEFDMNTEKGNGVVFEV